MGRKVNAYVLCLLCNVYMCVCAGLTFTSSTDSAFEMALNRKFGVRPPFLGADVATSCGGGIWIWGDTFQGTVQAGRRHIGSASRNSVSLQANYTFGFFPNVTANTWFWPTACVYRPESAALLVFAMKIENHEGGLGFRQLSSYMLVIGGVSPGSPPDTWHRQRAYPLPFTDVSVSFNAAALLINEHVVVLGQRQTPAGNYAVLSRIPWKHALSGLTYAFQTLNTNAAFGRPLWGAFKSADQLHSLFDKAPTETSLFYHANTQLFYTMAIPFASSQVNIRTSKRLEYGWSAEQVLLARIPDKYKPAGAFCYAPKSHPQLARIPQEIVWSYVCNIDFSELPDHLNVYTPKFVSTTILK